MKENKMSTTSVMRKITATRWAKMSNDYKSKLPDGTRLLLSCVNGKTCFIVEGVDFEIVNG